MQQQTEPRLLLQELLLFVYEKRYAFRFFFKNTKLLRNTLKIEGANACIEKVLIGFKQIFILFYKTLL